jgi:hypothetical protein
MAADDRARILVTAETSEAATLAATGTVSVPTAAKIFHLRKATATTPGGETMKLRLGLSRKAGAAVRRALAAGRKPTAKLRITATDTAGNRTVETRRIRLRG